jgi:hypothetical protein
VSNAHGTGCASVCAPVFLPACGTFPWAQGCGDDASARLFPHSRHWVRANVKRLCRKAGVPEVTAHGARGIHATIAAQMGATSHLVAAALGHGSTTVTERHYIRPGALEHASRDRLEKILETEVVEPASPTQGLTDADDASEREMGNPKTISHEEGPPEDAPLEWPKSLKSQDSKECEGGDSNPHSVNH